MPENRILRLKPALRLEWRGKDGQNKPNQRDHSASLGDSITSSTRIRFSVHTGAARTMRPRRADRATRAWRHRSDRSPGSWHEPSHPVLRRRGCADCAVASARHRIHLARHRAPRTTTPPAKSPVLRDKTELHVDSFAKSAAAFLRHSHLSVAWNSLQSEAQRLGAPLQIGETRLRYCSS